MENPDERHDRYVIDNYNQVKRSSASFLIMFTLDFQYNSDGDFSNHRRISIESMSIQCKHYYALRFKDESDGMCFNKDDNIVGTSANSSRAIVITFGWEPSLI